MRGYLIFEFRQSGCQIMLAEENARPRILAELSILDLLHLGIELEQAFALMEHGTTSYFTLAGRAEVPQAFYQAFEEGGEK